MDFTLGEAREISLLHEYDPVKAREYYLRNRVLKGRKKAAPEEPVGRIGSAVSITARPPAKKKPSLAAKRRRQRKEAEARVAALKVRLDRLRDILQELVKAAKARSGVDVEESKSPAQKQKDAKGKSPQTAAQKRDYAKRAKEKYDKEHQSTSKQAEELNKQIQAVEEKIRQARADLKEAIARGKKQTAPKNKSASKSKTEPEKAVDTKPGRR